MSKFFHFCYMKLFFVSIISGLKLANMFYTFFFYKKNVYLKMSLKNLKTLRKCYENLQPQMPQQFLKTLVFPMAL